MKLVLALAIGLMAAAQAAIPTAEGLFRNGSNHELDGNIALLDLIITEVENKKLLESTPAASPVVGVESAQAVMERNLAPPRYLRYIFDNLDRGYKLLQVDYSSNKMVDSNIIDVFATTTLRAKLNDEGYVERQLFYSLLGMYALNRSQEISDFLKKYCPEFKRNNEIINQEKKELYERYKKYLAAINSDASLAEKLENPLKPADEEDQKKVEQIQKSRMYYAEDQVSMVKRGDTFQWKVEFKNVLAYFSNQDHRLKSLNYEVPGASVSVNADNYVLYNGIHSLPKSFMIKQRDGRLFRVQILDYKNWKSPDYFSKKLNDYKEKMKARAVGEPEAPTMFLY